MSSIEQHSPMGPSSSDRWLHCTGSVLWTAGMPDTESEFAAEGTAAHMLSETVRKTGAQAKEYIGYKIKPAGSKFEFTVDAAMAGYVQEFCDFCEEQGGEAFYEARVHYTEWVDDGWGTADDIRLNGSTCYLTDLKYGKGIQVYAKNNSQLMLYALGVLQDFGPLYDIEDFNLVIHQPRLEHVDMFYITTEELVKWATDVAMPAAAAAFVKGAPKVPGDWCRFCRGKTECAERNKAMINLYRDDFDDLDSGTHVVLGEIMDRLEEFKAWIKDMEAKAMSETQKGEPPVGKDGPYKLVAGRSNRKWGNDVAAELALRNLVRNTPGKKVSNLFTKKLLTAPAAEKLFGKEVFAKVADQVTKPQGKPVLVAASDPRPTIQVKAEDEFSDLDNA